MPNIQENWVAKIRTYALSTIQEARITINGIESVIPLFGKSVISEKIEIKVYLDQTFQGNLSKIEILDTDGEVLYMREYAILKGISGEFFIFNIPIVSESTVTIT